MVDSPLMFAGSASPRLGKAVCGLLGIEPGCAEVHRFSEGGILVRLNEDVRGRDVFLVQSTVFPANEQLVELLFWLDAARRASAASVTAVIPYFNYAKGDKLDGPRTSVRARVCADIIQVAGADALIMLDLHSPQIQGFFTRPLDELTAMDVLCADARAMRISDLVVVSPDSGFVKKARDFAVQLGAPLAITDKRRIGDDERAEALDVIGDVENRNALIVDDFVISGRTLVETATKLLERGAASVRAAVSHGVFSKAAREVLQSSPIKDLVVTDSVEGHPWTVPSNVRTVSVAPLFAEAIRRSHSRESLGALKAAG
ncbi:MAG TPA: ribose-phosphate diphosphokinase [Candidatus Acidoferrales bacterium]|nr:ribose-phosphate diphosphokinase [Candidatus Acidoferrales bacterium]